MLSYILQVTLCWTAFYLLYLFLLRKETFFHTNRWYLLSTLVAGLLIPFVRWQPSPVIEHHPTYEIAIEPIQIQLWQLQNAVQEASNPFALDWLDIALAIYLSGAIFFVALLIHGLWKIWTLYKRSEIEQQGNIKVVYTSESHLPFSFFNLLFWSKNFDAALSEKAQILKHEEAHIHQWHTLDVLFLEVLNILFWCSPIIYFYRKSLRNTHEYLADALVLKDVKRKEYGHLLLKQSLSGLQIALANHFIHSQLKDRILMMTRNKSRKRAMMKYLPLLPILLLTILVFAKQDNRVQVEKAVANLVEIDTEKQAFTPSESLFIHPVQDPSKVNKTMGYGKRMNPIKKQRDFHHGIDYVVPTNTKIVATAKGKIEHIRKHREGYGKHIIIAHENGYQTLYAHLNEINVTLGQEVKQGQLIALSGNSGLSTGPHLHYEIRKDGKSVDPEKIAVLDKNTEAIEKFAKQQMTYDPAYVRASFVAAFNDKTLSLEERSDLLSEDYALFIAKFPKHQEDIQNTMKQEVFMRGLKMEIAATNKVILSQKQLLNGASPKDIKEKNEAMKIVEEMPYFPSEECATMTDKEAKQKCSNNALMQYLFANLKYPKAAKDNNIEGMVVLKFIVQKDGTLSDIKVIREIGGGCGDESLRVVEKMNKDSIRWIAGRDKGEAVAVEFTLPIKFKLADDSVTEAKVEQDEEIFKLVEKMPRFPSEECEAMTTESEKSDCSKRALISYIIEHTKYPKTAKEAGIEGMCVVQFTIEKDGRVSEIELVRDIGGGCGAASKAVIEQMNEDDIRWIPGVQRDQIVRVRYTMPFKFKLSEKEKKLLKENFDPTPLKDKTLNLEAFKVSPNPSNGNIQLQFKAKVAPISVKVMDLKGQIIYEENIQDFEGTYNRQITLKNVATGMHYLSIEQNEKVYVEQVLIEK